MKSKIPGSFARAEPNRQGSDSGTTNLLLISYLHLEQDRSPSLFRASHENREEEGRKVGRPIGNW
ncbi:hypothetical protein [Algoriphagus winogradskyi]|uniref:hypothetical protein n=1 Tax=Algoriphagus winogradskyi TaxID=237017 RepID=UPI0024B69781|nr:hypothetical protein [Algoriphagus winogradskyi]